MTGKMCAYDLIKKKRDGELFRDEAEKAGISMRLGAGRQRAEDVII